jgi:hypothetical protein
MKSCLLSSVFVFLLFSASAQYYPPPACIQYDNGVLTVCPPDSVPSYSGGLLGYNLYQDGQYLVYVPASDPADSVEYTFDPLPDPGARSFCAKAVYQNWISDEICDSTLLRYGFELPFEEDWSSGTFEANNWTTDETAWCISSDEGNPGPCAKFNGSAGLQNYSEVLISYPILGDSIFFDYLHIDFDFKLNSLNSTGNENLLYQLWDWSSDEWHSPASIANNSNGSINWTHRSLTLGIRENVIKIRFIAEGQNSGDIEGWHLDNIVIHRDCLAPFELNTIINDDQKVELFWAVPSCGNGYAPLCWSSNVNYEYIGTGLAAEFDVAGRWTSADLNNYNGKYIEAISIYPGEANAQYSVRIWEGDSAVLVYEKQVENPQIHDWTYVQLDTLYEIDASKTLWIGYHIQASEGYPAGVDAGPAHNGSGNMMYWEGQWQTLLEVNSSLDYNWMITAHVAWGPPFYCGSRIYRSINGGEYDRIMDGPMIGDFVDEEADPMDLNCYLVTNVFAQLGDTCESGFSPESCITSAGVPGLGNLTGELLYPNPAKDLVNIEFPSEMGQGEKIINIYNNPGRNIKSITIPQNQSKTKMDISDIPVGLYMVSISNQEKIYQTCKLMIIR